ncbi:MAG: ATP-binding cassette domain-containing protein [Proteobacteria bacterium]|nr:ATP-binding cassette domain-containing protein [Pseudomonadota bacterium]
MSQLRIENLCFQNRGPIDLTVEPSQCVCLSGPSGSGKTMLLRAIVDLDPHEGRIFLDDVECNDIEAPDWRRQVSLLPAESQWWGDTVGSHFENPDENLLETLGFTRKVLSWQVSRLSTGERQRLALVRLLGNGPRAMLLDEPTASLDSENIGHVERLVAEYRKTHGTPVLWVSHDPNQIERVADRHFVVSERRLVERKLP